MPKNNPTITALMKELRLINDNHEGRVAVYLEVYDDSWTIHHGQSLTHFDREGALVLPGVGGPNMQPQKFPVRDVATFLLARYKVEDMRYR